MLYFACESDNFYVPLFPVTNVKISQDYLLMLLRKICIVSSGNETELLTIQYETQ